MSKIEIVRGNTPIIIVRFRSRNGNVVNLTGFTDAKLTVKKNTSLPDTSAVMTLDGTVDEENGIVSFPTTYSDTCIVPGEYLWDAMAVNSTTMKVVSTKPDVFTVHPSVRHKAFQES